MAEHLPAFAEELQRDAEPTTPARIAERFRQLGAAFAVVVAVSLAACNLLCWGGF